MARIFYSMAGEGRGHATRVRAIVESMRHEHQFSLFAPAAAFEMLSNAFDGTGVRVTQIPGLLFHYTGRRLNYFQTLRHAAGYLWGLNGLVRQLQSAIQIGAPDLVITDFEPALPRAAARCGVPFLSIDHQHFLVTSDFSTLPRPLRLQAAVMAPIVNAYYGGQVETVVSSFYFPRLKRGCGEIVQTGVLLRPEVHEARPEWQSHLLVYLRRFADRAILETLQRCGREVLIYGLGDRPRDGNLLFRAVDEQSFLEDLATCDALISNAGNQLVGEALYLGKPVLAIPEAKNFEQFINAHYLREGGGGDWVDAGRFDDRTLRDFLIRTADYQQAIPRERLDGLPDALTAIQRHLPQPAAVPKFETALFQKVA
jgi:uncharacterized protein (TIGR00661 family)